MHRHYGHHGHYSHHGYRGHHGHHRSRTYAHIGGPLLSQQDYEAGEPEDLDEGQILEDFVEAFEDEKATPPDFGWGPEPRRDDPIDQERGVEHREYLSDFVRRGDPRSKAERSRWNPDNAYLVNPGYDEGPPSNGVPMSRLLDLNLHGLTDMQSANDDEMRLLMQTSRSALPEEIGAKLLQRFECARDRAYESELRTFGPNKRHMMPTYVSSKVVANPDFIDRAFDAQTRRNDMERAIAFYHSNPHHLGQLLQSAGAADLNERSQYGDHVRDLIGRIEMRSANPKDPAPLSVSVSRDPLDPLNIPVLSRAKWTTKSARVETDEDDGGAAKEPPPSYYRRGNEEFLASRLNLRTAASRLQAEEDAVRFFRTQFGLDFSKQSGARADPKTGAIQHAALPAVLEPYMVAAGDALHTRLHMAEGHLASAVQRQPDGTGNGYERFGNDAAVMEVGWMVRPTAQAGLELPKRQASRLPRGGVLNTGFWMIHRPDAAPALLRFQSSKVPEVSFEKAKGGGFRHISTNFYTVTDMAHDAAARPYKGVGSAVSVVSVDHPHRKNINAQTWVTLLS